MTKARACLLWLHALGITSTILADSGNGAHLLIAIDFAHDSYAAWREGVHDDLVFAVALACWMRENQRRAWAL